MKGGNVMAFTSSDLWDFAKRFAKRAVVVIGAVALLAWGVCGSMGCTGLNALFGHHQSKIYEWRENGSFWVEAKGSQTEAFEMNQTTTTYNKDGTVAAVDVYALKVTPDHGQTGATMAAGFEASAKMLETVDKMLGKVAPSFAAPPTALEVPTPPID